MKHLLTRTVAAATLALGLGLALVPAHADDTAVLTRAYQAVHTVGMAGGTTSRARNFECRPDYQAGYDEGNDDALDALVKLGAKH